jgi:hypothetical protein
MKLWKSFRVNMMYWRFRYVTRNRLRFQAWWNARRRPRVATTASSVRPRASAMYYPMGSGSSQRQSWQAFGTMIVLLTALTSLAGQYYIAPTLVYAVGTLIIVGCIYWGLRGI